MSEVEIIRLCCENSPVGQRALYDRFHVSLSRLCFRYVRDESIAFEVLTSGFLKIFSEVQNFQYQREGSFSAWMRKIMINESLMYLRKNKDSVLHVALDEEILNKTVELTDAEYLYQAIRDLPDGCREIFNMFVIDGFSHKEIAAKLDIGESTSRSQLGYARKLLQQKLNLLL